MDNANIAATQLPRPSAIPRPGSRLPVLNKRPSQATLARPEGESISEAAQKPRLQKRSSIASFSRSTSTSSVAKEPSGPSKTLALPPVRVATTGLKQPSKLSTGPRIAPRPSSRGNQQRRPPSPRKPLPGPEDEENHDQLSSLDSFGSASRQGFHDESPTEPPDHPPLSATPKGRKSSRPSLSDRTIESLQNVPATPKDRRRSSFFSPIESPMGPPPRPASALSRNGSDRSSRPGTSDGTFAGAVGRASTSTMPISSSAKPATRTSLGGFGFTPRTSSRLPSASKPNFSRDQDMAPPRSPSPSKRVPAISRPNGMTPGKVMGSKTVGGRAPKPRPALSDAFGPPVQAGNRRDAESTTAANSKPVSAPSPAPSQRATSNPASNSSSSALRQQIAAAKAAAQQEKSKPQGPSAGISGSIDAAFDNDPFNQAPRDEKHILRNRIATARMDGKLNIAALGLKEIPEVVMKMYDPTAMEESNVSWAEVVDLTRLNVADNEIKELGQDVFPDLGAEDFAADDYTSGNQFGGLESLDLHGNRLTSLPMGLRRLERLTMLNLSHNKLENSALEVIAQVSSLRDLRLGHNALSGSLLASLCRLQKLENLDVQSNRLLSLPESLRDLVNLRVLNVSGNQLTALPTEALQNLRLTELNASSNALIGPLFPPGTTSAHATLQTLKVANNSLAALTFAERLHLPALECLDVTNNHLTALPPVSAWTELITLMAGENKITQIPEGLHALRKLRHVNFASNVIRLVSAEIGRMESLEGLVLSGNPLRDKKFLTLNAQDIKRDLRARLEPAADDVEDGDLQPREEDAGSVAPAAVSPTAGWTLKAGRSLDLSGQRLTDAINDTLGAFLQAHEVRQLNLSGNKLTSIPPALWLAQDLRVLDLSGNALALDYLSDELELPALTELRLRGCSLTTLEPLISHLKAPNLNTLEISANRLIGAVPSTSPLRTYYPALTTLFAADNKFTFVSADAMRGLQTVNLQSNDLKELPAEIGLLWFEGLRQLEVGSNAFRMPNHQTLAKGTESAMKWLRGRIPGYEGKG